MLLSNVKTVNIGMDAMELNALKADVVLKILKAYLLEYYSDLGGEDRTAVAKKLAALPGVIDKTGVPDRRVIAPAMGAILQSTVASGELQLVQDHARVVDELRKLKTTLPMSEPQMIDIATRICRETNLYVGGFWAPSQVAFAAFRMAGDPTSKHLFMRPETTDGAGKKQSPEDAQRAQFYGYTEKEWHALTPQVQLRLINEESTQAVLGRGGDTREDEVKAIDKLCADTLPEMFKDNARQTLNHWEKCAQAIREGKAKPNG